MNLANCPECGKLYVKNAAGLCPDCRIGYEEQVEKVLQYMRDVPKATVAEISEATGVKSKIILDLIKRGVLAGSGCVISYPCECCGKLIEEGKLCRECCSKISSGLKSEEYKTPETKYSEKSKSKWHMQ